MASACGGATKQRETFHLLSNLFTAPLLSLGCKQRTMKGKWKVRTTKNHERAYVTLFPLKTAIIGGYSQKYRRGNERKRGGEREIIRITNIQNTFTKKRKNSQVQFSLQIGGFALLLKSHKNCLIG